MASPIQVILNASNFTEDREKPLGRGKQTDFFADDDQGFASHRDTLVGQLASISGQLRQQAATYGEVGFVKVILRKKAWAKSHRPIQALFTERRTPIVGGLDLGQLVVEATPYALAEVAAQMNEAETEVPVKTKDGKSEPNPSRRRSETGAIERIELYGAGDKRHFELDQAVVWLSSARTGGEYEVELFEEPPPQTTWDDLGNRRQLFRSFMTGLQGLGSGLRVQLINPRSGKEAPHLAIRLERSALPPLVQLAPSPIGQPSLRDIDGAVAPFDNRTERHSQLLAFLDKHPLVRRVDLPGIVVRSAGPICKRPGWVKLPERNTSRQWPRVGVIDGGISDEALSDWIIGRWDLLAEQDIDAEHGTFIGGILVAGSDLNGPNVSGDADGVELFDIAVFPASDGAFSTYHGDLSGFIDGVEAAIIEARTRHGVRVFNFSLNVQNAVAPNYYSKIAARLDEIADAHDVLIFISAGNLDTHRAEWPELPASALQMIASSQNDGILVPAESARNVSVGALNTPNVPGIVSLAPARYSRRGPGMRALVKPDFGHVGGIGEKQPDVGHGLFSVGVDGGVVDSCGTSYATPFVARQAAMLDNEIEGAVSRETLIALLAHHAGIPECLKDKTLSGIGRQLAGHGMTSAVRGLLEGGDHEITMVFAARLHRDRQMNFRFAWPACLVGPDSVCRGSAKLTLVSSPPLDQRFGAEFVRVNIEAALQQEQISKAGKTSWKGQLKPLYLPPSHDYPYESERIEHGLKWSPVKVSGAEMPAGRGNSSNWRLMVSYQSRSDNREIPEVGVPFTAILTISDLKGDEPVFNVLRQQLSPAVQLADIRTAARVVSRV